MSSLVLVINSGSSSIKYQLVDADSGDALAGGIIERIGQPMGSIKHDGSGFSLTAGDTKVELTNFTIDPGKSILYGDVSVNGTSAATQVDLFNLYGGTLKPLQMDGNNAILTGTTVHISADAAGLLNKTFKTEAVKSQLLVGIATITVIAK